MMKRHKPERRRRIKVERKVHRDRLRAPRRYRITPDPARPYVIQLILSRDSLRMREAINWYDGQDAADSVERHCGGLVRSWRLKRGDRRAVVRPGRLVARVHLNARDLHAKPAEIVVHEAGHAAMAWARFCRANLDVMPGEEVMCYALGRLVDQINRICHAAGAFR